MARTLKLYKLPEDIQMPGLRPIQKSDIPGVYRLLTAHLKKFQVSTPSDRARLILWTVQLASQFTEAEVEHWFSIQEGVVYCYVKQDPATKGHAAVGRRAGLVVIGCPSVASLPSAAQPKSRSPPRRVDKELEGSVLVIGKV
eukprot:764465-Hanusia_phi.AAC.3